MTPAIVLTAMTSMGGLATATQRTVLKVALLVAGTCSRCSPGRHLQYYGAQHVKVLQ